MQPQRYSDNHCSTQNTHLNESLVSVEEDNDIRQISPLVGDTVVKVRITELFSSGLK